MAQGWSALLASIALAACSQAPVNQAANAAGAAGVVNTGTAATLRDSNPLESGRQLMASGDPAQAAERFQMAVDADPNDPVALNNLAIARANLGDYRAAYELLRRASALAPQRADIAANRDRLGSWLNSRSNIVLSHAGTDADAPVPDSAASAEVPPLWDPSMAEQVIAPAGGATDAAVATAIPVPPTVSPTSLLGPGGTAGTAGGNGAADADASGKVPAAATPAGAMPARPAASLKASDLMLDPGESVIDPATLEDASSVAGAH
ncbi:MAG: tetratricopeptide repeat protein [Janthinobacterium lividum]